MSETVFTFAGKAGDALHQWPVAWWWAKQTGKRFTCWLDEASCKMVAPASERGLLRARLITARAPLRSPSPCGDKVRIPK